MEITKRIKIGNVLVHCEMGRSRSVSLLIFYLMKTLDITYEDAYELIKAKRYTINPQFEELIKNYDKSITNFSNQDLLENVDIKRHNLSAVTKYMTQ